MDDFLVGPVGIVLILGAITAFWFKKQWNGYTERERLAMRIIVEHRFRKAKKAIAALRQRPWAHLERRMSQQEHSATSQESCSRRRQKEILEDEHSRQSARSESTFPHAKTCGSVCEPPLSDTDID